MKRLTSLDACQDDSWILNSSLDLSQEKHGLTSIDQAMIVGQGNVHHRADLNLQKSKC